MDENRMSPFEHAIIDSIKTIIELLHSKGLLTHEECAAQFHAQWLQAGNTNPYGMVVFQILESFCRNYGTAHKLIEEPPAGSA